MGVEAANMRELFNHLRAKPNDEAADIYRRIRMGSDVDSSLKFLQDGDLFLQPAMASVVSNQTATSFRNSIWGFSEREKDLYLWALSPASLGFTDRSKFNMIQSSFKIGPQQVSVSDRDAL